MDPHVKNIMVSVGVIYHATTLLQMVAMVRRAHKILQAVTNSVNAISGLRGDILGKGSAPI